MIITVADDGRGIDARKVAEKAAERGLIAPTRSTRSTCARAVELLFSAGFSTAEVTSDISGRGVGMDAVRAAIRGLGGEVLMTSELGQGTSAQIRLPLTLAIMAALIVEADGRPFAIPLDRIERTVRVADQAVRSVAGRRMLVLSDGVLPIVDASEHYGGAGDRRRRVRRRRARRRRPLRAHRLAGSSASTSSSPVRCPPRSPTVPPCRAPPCSRTGRSPSSSTATRSSTSPSPPEPRKDVR